MTLSRRVVSGFLVIIVLLVLFGTFILYAFFEMQSLSEERLKLYSIQALVVKIKSDTLNYKTTEERNYVYSINDSIDRIKGIYNDSDFNTLSDTLDSKVQTILASLDAFKVEMNNYMVLNDQVYAINVQLQKTTQDLIELISLQHMDTDLSSMQIYTQLMDALFKLSMNQQNLTAEAQNHRENYLEQLNQLESIGRSLQQETFGLEKRLLGVRIINLVQEHSEVYKKTLESTEFEEKFDYLLYQLTLNLDDIVMRVIDNERSIFIERNEALVTLSVGLLFIFVAVALYTSYSIATRMKTNLTKLIEATHLIAIGEYKERIDLKGDADIENLASGINEMAIKLDDSRHALEGYNARLLALVEEKTKEINAVNQELEAINDSLMIEKERLALSAMTDYLTQLKNRAFLVEFLRQRIQEFKRYSKPFSVLLFDVDRFKLVNDTYGHQIGDMVLRFIADTLVTEIRQADLAGRYGGEEFVVILTDTPIREALFVGERIRTTIENHIFDIPQLHITVSAGLMEYKGETEDDLLKKVDLLLYEAKETGRNRIVSEDL